MMLLTPGREDRVCEGLGFVLASRYLSAAVPELSVPKLGRKCGLGIEG